MAKQDITEVSGPTQFKSGDEAVESGRKGGIASGEARRAKKTAREIARAILDEITTSKEGVEATVRYAALKQQASKALKGDIKATEFLIKVADEMPKQQAEVEHHGEVGLTINHMASGIIPAESEEEVLKREGINGTF